MPFFREHASLFTAVGAGVAVCIVYVKMTNKIMIEMHQLSGTIHRLSDTITELKAEVNEMKEKLEQSKRKPRPGSGFYSTSSGEEDEEVYEEAYGGWVWARSVWAASQQYIQWPLKSD